MRTVVKALAAGLLALVVGVGTTACGIPIDHTPEPLEIPPQYRSTETTNTPPEVATEGSLTVTLCLTRDGRLVPHVRTVEAPRSPQQLLADLIDGPTESEVEDLGLGSALTGLRSISVAGINGGIVEVAVGDLEGITATSQLLIFAQIVCTIDALDSVAGVRFSQDGEPLAVPRFDLTSAEIVYADDYAGMLESSATPTP